MRGHASVAGTYGNNEVVERAARRLRGAVPWSNSETRAHAREPVREKPGGPRGVAIYGVPLENERAFRIPRGAFRCIGDPIVKLVRECGGEVGPSVSRQVEHSD